jgi:hypothetical protein
MDTLRICNFSRAGGSNERDRTPSGVKCPQFLLMMLFMAHVIPDSTQVPISQAESRHWPPSVAVVVLKLRHRIARN